MSITSYCSLLENLLALFGLVPIEWNEFVELFVGIGLVVFGEFIVVVGLAVVGLVDAAIVELIDDAVVGLV